MKNIQRTIIGLFLCVGMVVHAQWPEKDSTRFIVSGVPQYLAVNGLRIDFDIRQGDSRNWWILSPYYFTSSSAGDFYNLGGSDEYYDSYTYEDMKGFGLGISRRRYLSKESTSEGFYLSYGATYKYYKITGDNFIWVEFTGEDGLTYQHMEDTPYSMDINAMSGHATLGWQVQVAPSWYMDFYMGVGLRYSSHYSPEKVTIKYNRGVNDYGYTGTQFVGGFRMGFGI